MADEQATTPDTSPITRAEYEALHTELAEIGRAMKSLGDPDRLDAAAKAAVERLESAERPGHQLPATLFAPPVDHERPGTSAKDLVLGASDDPKVVRFQKANDRGLILRKLASTYGLDEAAVRTSPIWKELQASAAECKALSSTGSATGDEFVPTNMSPQVKLQARLENRTAALFPIVNPTSNPYLYPFEGTIGLPYRQAEPTTDNAANIPSRTPATGKATFTASTMALSILMSYHFQWDSVVDAVDFIQRKVTQSLSDGIEACIYNGDLNGQTAGSHMDAGVTSATDARTCFDGLRMTAQDPATDRTADIDGWAQGDMATLIALLTAELVGSDLNSVHFAMSHRTYAKMFGDNTNWPSIQTVDLFGQDRALVRGNALATVFGHPILVSSQISNTHNSAVADAGNGTDTVVYAFVPNVFGLAFWEQPTIEMWRDTRALQAGCVGYQRVDWEPFYTSSSYYGVAVGYDVT